MNQQKVYLAILNKNLIFSIALLLVLFGCGSNEEPKIPMDEHSDEKITTSSPESIVEPNPYKYLTPWKSHFVYQVEAGYDYRDDEHLEEGMLEAAKDYVYNREYFSDWTKENIIYDVYYLEYQDILEYVIIHLHEGEHIGELRYVFDEETNTFQSNMYIFDAISSVIQNKQYYNYEEPCGIGKMYKEGKRVVFLERCKPRKT